MSNTVDFYFDYGSPTSYIAMTRVRRLAEKTGAKVTYKPVLLGGIFQATTNHSPMDIPSKRDWMVDDMKFFAKRLGIPFTYNEHFPINTLNMMRGAIYAQDKGFLSEYSAAIYDGMWGRGLNMADIDTLKGVLTQASLPADDIVSGTQDPAVKARLKSETEDAVARGLFGVPTLFVGGQMFFGQDRIEYAEELLL